MTYSCYEFFDHEWIVSNEGVVSVCNRPRYEPGSSSYVVHGLIVSAKYDENVAATQRVMLNGGVLCLVVADKFGKRRALYLSKDNLCLDKVQSAEDGKFMYSMLQAAKKSEDPITSKIFWGTFCGWGCLRYETTFCGLLYCVCARVYHLVLDVGLGRCARWQQDAERNSPHY